jgi:electron transport complex protein RnfG
MEAETEAMLSEMFPEMTRYDFANDIYILYSNGNRIGYAFVAIGKGYGGDIDILVGLEDENTVKGITIISNEETPGLGTRITEPSFTDQFDGLVIDEVALEDEGGEIDAITGSTISSAAVINAVRTAAQEKVTLIQEGQDD